MADSFPKAYVNEVPKEGKGGPMEYVPFDTLGIGARKSGLPDSASDGPKGLDHVGGSTSGRK